MKKEKTILKKVTSMMLLMTLTMAQFLYVTTTAVQAVYEELESQSVNIENTNVSFNVSYEDGTHSKQLKISEGGVISCNIKIEKNGVLNNAKIHIENPNFKIDEEKLDKTFVKAVDVENNDITLNQIVTGEKNIKIPVKFEKKDIVASDYFDKQNTFTFTAEYKVENKTEKSIQKNIIIDTQWTDDVDTNIENEFVKFQSLDETNVMLEQKISVETANQILPKQEENIELEVPELDGIKPSKINVLKNGKEIDSKYDADLAKLNIQNKNEVNNEQINWKTDKDVYKIIYLYEGKINVRQTPETVKGTITTKYYGKTDTIQKVIEQEKAIKPTTEIISAEEISTKELPKEYFNVKSSKKAYIEETATIEIPEISQIKDISIEVGKTYFANKGRVPKNTFLESTYINKEEFLNIFGQEAKIKVLNQDGQEIATIDKETETEGDYIVVKYPENITKATLKFENVPEKIGEINIKNKKYFVGDIGFTQKQLEEYDHIENEINIIYNGKTVSAISNTSFSQAEEKVEVSVNNANLGTTDINKGVELYATLKTKELSNVLYKNPVIQLVFPKQVKNVRANSIKLLYGEELQIVKAEGFNREDGAYVIKLTINGEQKDYKKDIDEEALIVVNADIELYKDIPSFTAPIEVVVENVGQEAKTFNVQINGNAKTGVFTYSNVEGYKDGENTESLGTEVKDISLPTKDTAKTIKREVTVVNNNNFDVQDAKVEGTISNTNDSKEVKLSYAKGIQELNNQETVEYSYEKSGENWTTNVEDYSKVQRFRINVGTMTSGQTSKFEYEVNVQEQQDGGLQGYMQDTVNYSINEQTLSETNKTTVSTPQIASVENEATKNDNISTVVTPKETQDQTKDENKADSTDKSTSDGKITDNKKTTEDEKKTEQVEPLTVEYVAKKADKAIKDGDEVFEGEVISYHVKITNNTKNKIKGLTAVATQENAIFYNEIKVEGQNAITLEKAWNIFYREDENCKEIKKENLEIEAGKSIEFDYEFATKKITDTKTTKGNIKITAEGLDEKNYETLKNPIKDTKIKVAVMNTRSEENTYGTNDLYSMCIQVQNLTDQELTNIDLKEYVSDGLILSKTTGDREDLTDIKQDENGQINLKIDKLAAKGEYIFNQNFKTKEMPTEQIQKEASILVNATVKKDTVQSNILKMKYNQTRINMEVSYTGSAKEKNVRNGDKIDYVLDIKGNSSIDKEVTIDLEIPNGCVINKAVMSIDGTETDIKIEEGIFSKTVKLTAKGEIKIKINTTVDSNEAIESQLESTVNVFSVGQESVQKEIVYLLEDYQNSDDADDDAEQQLPEIMGVVWNDENQNGERELEEEVLQNMTVKLIDVSTGKQINEQKTNEFGEYDFKDLANGKYLVAVVYDKNTYKPTIYQKDGVKESVNSDVVAKTSNDEELAVTDILEVKNTILENIDAGFIKNKVFDLRLDKTVTEVTLQNGSENTIKSFSDSKLAKVEIHAKKVANTTVQMKYKIKITNEGEVVGTATDIIDYMPEDVTFDKTLNQTWYKDNDGNLHTAVLSDVKINPGESKEVTLILTKKMTENNLGTTYNTAEIASVSNSENLLDKDSTPNNKQNGEDDFSEADVIVSIKTGTAFVISFIIIAMLAGVLYVVFYVRKEEKYEK